MDFDKIVDEYSEHLGNQPNTGHMVRDVVDLPYPREMIRSAIKHCMAEEKDPKLLDLYKTCYLALAYYQTLSPSERRAVEAMSDLGQPDMTLEQVKELAQNLAPHLEVHSALMERVQADDKALSTDISEMEFRDAPVEDLSNAHLSPGRGAVEKFFKHIREQERGG